MTYYDVQQIAKMTMDYISDTIYPGQSLIAIRQLCEEKMRTLGADSFWYYDIGAFVFSGSDTSLSLSGRKYKTADKTIDENDIITIDLSPSCKKIWGDYARTIVIENGKVIRDTEEISNAQWRSALQFEKELHKELYKIVNVHTTFEDIYCHMNNMIESAGYINLDFNGNLGHTIRRHKLQRTYIEKGNQRKLSSVKYFTFEPHIGKKDCTFGFKREDIYFFENNKLNKL